jgi:tetratricopeptide (TPR) repeat protein
VNRAGRAYRRTRIAIVAGAMGGVVHLPVVLGAPATATPAAAVASVDGAHEIWLFQQLRKFRSHPHFDRAYRLTSAGRLDAAAVEFANGLQIDPRNVAARLDYVQVLARLQRHQDVIDEVGRLSGPGQSLAAARTVRAMAYQALGQPELAAADLAIVAASDEATAAQRQFAHRSLADLAVRRKRFGDAMGQLEAIDASGRDAAYYLRRAVVQESLGRLAEAQVDYRRMLEGSASIRERVDAFAALARVSELRGDRDSAWRHLREAIALDESNPALTLALAELAYRRQRYGEAIDWARRAVALHKGPRERELLADSLMASADFAAAQGEFSALLAELKDGPDRRRVLAALAHVLDAQGKRAQAAQLFASAATEQSSTANARPVRAPASARSAGAAVAGSESRRAAAGAVELISSDAPARAFLNAAYKSGDMAEAIRWATRIVQQAPDAKDREFLANLLFAHKDYRAALQQYRELLTALGDAEDRRRIHVALGNSHAALHEDGKAAEAFEKAFEIRADPQVLESWIRALELSGDTTGLVRALARSPSPQASLRLASLLLQTGRTEEGLERLRKLASPGVAAAVRGEALRRIARAAYGRADLDEARAAATALLALAPQDVDGHLTIARVELDEQHPAAALAHVQQSVERSPTAEAYRLLAYAHGLLGDWASSARARQSEIAVGGLSTAEQIEAYKALGHAQAQTNDWAGAGITYERLFNLAGQSLEQRAEAADRLANAYRAQQRDVDAAMVTEQAIAAGVDTARLHLSAGFARFAAHQWREALAHFQRAAAEEPAGDEAAVYVARCYEKLGMPGLSIHHLLGALQSSNGVASARRREILEQLGQLYAQGMEYDRAAAMYREALAIRSSADVALRLARMLWLAERRDEATATLEALGPAGLSPKVEVERLDMLAEAHHAAGREREAIALLERARSLEPSAERDQALGVRLLAAGARDRALELLRSAYRQSGRPEHAESLRVALFEAERFDEAATLLGSSPDLAEQRVAFYQNVAYHYKRQARNAEAVAWFKRGIDEALAQIATRKEHAELRSAADDRAPGEPAPAPDRDDHPTPVLPARTAVTSKSARDLIARADGQDRAGGSGEGGADDAVAPVALQAANDDIVVPLRSTDALAAPGDELGAEVPEPVVALATDTPEPAIAAATDAPDPAAAPATDAVSELATDAVGVRVAQAEPDAPDDLQKRLAGMQSEVRTLQNVFDFTLYESYRAKTAGAATSTAAAAPSGGVVPSEGGLELAYQPPGIGFRNERTLQLFGRLLWANRPDSLRIDDQSVQAGFGVRYKPLQEHQFYVSGERLAKVGSNATNDWLLRASYGWTNGFEPPVGRANWNYTTVYADTGYFTRSQTWAFYGEARQGRSFAVAHNIAVTPHVVVDGRRQSPDPGKTSYLEGGGGVSAKLFFDESRYEGYRASAELLVQYKRGFSHVPSGWLVTAVLRY